MSIPTGFEPLPTNSPFFMANGPIYYKSDGDGVVIGLAVENRHCNTGGRLHGAMFSALADVALGNNIATAINHAMSASEAVEKRANDRPPTSIATVSLSVDFAGAAAEGDWVEVHAEVQKVGGTLAYASCNLRNGDDRIGQANGIFRILRKK
jgi:acyl-coenzyme A thioesterase PaaI-like protein